MRTWWKFNTSRARVLVSLWYYFYQHMIGIFGRYINSEGTILPVSSISVDALFNYKRFVRRNSKKKQTANQKPHTKLTSGTKEKDQHITKTVMKTKHSNLTTRLSNLNRTINHYSRLLSSSYVTHRNAHIKIMQWHNRRKEHMICFWQVEHTLVVICKQWFHIFQANTSSAELLLHTNGKVEIISFDVELSSTYIYKSIISLHFHV